ncbi:PepSY domain-containing protein [Bacillus sp. N9]
MKRKILIASVIGSVIFGGAIGANAISNTKPEAEVPNSTISMEKAAEIAKSEVEGIIKSVELDEENGRDIYEVEFTNNVDVEVDAVTGEIVKVDRDNDNKRNVVKQNKTILKEEAMSIALNDTRGVISEVDFDSDDNEYEIEVKTNGKEVEIKINGATGKIISKEMDEEKF